MEHTTCTRCTIEDDLFIVGIKAYCSKCFLTLSKEPRETECSSCNMESTCFLKGVKYFCEDCIEYNLCQKDNANYCIECNSVDEDQICKYDATSSAYMCIDCGKDIYKRKICSRCNIFHIKTICIFGPLENGVTYCNTCKRYHDGTCKHCSMCMDYVPSTWDHCGFCRNCGPKERTH